MAVGPDAFGFGNSNLGANYGQMGANGSGVVIPPQTGDILLVDGVSLLLQTDAASFVCLAGGC